MPQEVQDIDMHPLNSTLKHIAMSTATETEKLRSSIHLPFSAIKLKQKLGRRTKTTGEGSPRKKKREKGKTSPGEIAVPIFARQPRCTPNSVQPSKPCGAQNWLIKEIHQRENSGK